MWSRSGKSNPSAMKKRYSDDIRSVEHAAKELLALSEKVVRRLRRHELKACTITLKVKYPRLSTDYPVGNADGTGGQPPDCLPAVLPTSSKNGRGKEAGAPPGRLAFPASATEPNRYNDRCLLKRLFHHVETSWMGHLMIFRIALETMLLCRVPC